MNCQTFATTLLLVTTLVTTFVTGVGCSSLHTGKWSFAKSLDVRRAMWWKSEKPEPQLPVRLVSTWTDTILHKPGQKSQRGFGGRLVFFGRESDDPVCVDGQLVVYAYDEANSDARTAQPTRRFIFPREQFTRHYSESTLGPSYSVWLPWDAVGGPRKNISLIARFEPYLGQLIVGEQTRHLLPGTALAEDVPADQPGKSEIQLAQHTTTAGAESRAGNSLAKTSKSPLREMTTTSIRMSEQWRNRFASQSAQGSLRERFSASTIQPPIQPPIPQQKGP